MSNDAFKGETLPAKWMDRIWSKLSIRYGQAFIRRWDGLELDDVKADWSEQLANFVRRPDRIAYALENLPVDKAPTVGEFRVLCNSKPEKPVTAIDWKRGPVPAHVMQALDKLKEPKEVDAQYAGPTGWAYRLRDREAAGDVLGVMQRRCWREALRETA